MKTKTTKLLVLLMAVVMQGFVSVSWGQEGESKIYTISDITSWNDYNNLTDKDSYTKIEITYPLVCDVAADTVIVTLELSESVTEIDGGGNEIIGANCSLFSLIRQNCIVKNVKVSGSTINYTYTPEPPASISPFANYNSGTIKNCSVENCKVTCQLPQSSDSPYEPATGEEKNCIYIGGLAGTNYGIISNCIAKDNNLNYWLSGENTTYKLYSGQIAGYNEKTVDENNNPYSKINNCFCHISNIDYHLAHVFYDVSIDTKDLKADDESGNYHISKAIVGKTEGEMKDNLVLFAEAYKEDSGYNWFQSVPTITCDGCRYVYPYFKGYISDVPQYRDDANEDDTFVDRIGVQKCIFDYVNNASDTIKLADSEIENIITPWGDYSPIYFPTIDPYGVKRKYYSDTVEIASVEDWNEFAQNYVVAEEQNVDFLVEKVIIKSDLDFSGKELYSIPILSNTVTLDGQGHTFSGNNVTIDEKQPFVGLVGKNEGTIKNIVISGLNVKVYPKETIEEVYISYEEGYKEETIYTSSLLCGYNNGTIERCAVEKSVMTVPEADNHIVGFLVGYQESYCSIINCYSAYNTAGGVTSGSISQMVGKSNSSAYCDNSFVILPTNQQSNDTITYHTFVGNDDVGIEGKNNAVFYIKTGTEDHSTFEPSTDCKEVYVPSIGDNVSSQTQKIYSSQKELQKYIDEYALKISWSTEEPSKEYNVRYHRFEFADNTLVDDVAKVANWPYLTTDLIPVINNKGEYEIRTTEDIEALRRYNIFSKEGATIVLKDSLELRWYEGEDSNGKILESPSISLGKGVTFDGGGYRLKTSDYAFVDTVYSGATLKNLMIDAGVWNFSGYSGSSEEEEYNAGFLANVNQGTIESCGLYPNNGNIDSDVESFRTIVNWNTDEQTIVIPDTVNIGYLVGKNEGGIIENCMLIAQRRDATNGDRRMVSLSVSPYIEYDYIEDVSIEYNPKEVNFGTIVGKAEGGQIHNVYTLYKYCDFDNARVNNFGYIIGKIGDNVDLDNLYYYDKARNGKSEYDDNYNLNFYDHESLNIKDNERVGAMYHSEDNIPGTNDSYGMKEEYLQYCYNLPTFIANFSNPMKWRNAQSGTEDDKVYVVHYNAPILTFSNLDAVIDDEIKVVDLILTDTTEVAEFTEALKNNPEVYSNAIVTLGNDIDYSNDEADADVPETLPFFNQLGGGDAPFNGVFDGAGYAIANFAVQADSAGSGGFFKNVSDTAVVKNLNIENAVLVVTNADSLLTYSNGEDIGEKKDTIYIAVFADKNGGELKNCSFAGRIKVDESILNSGKEVKVCFTGENTSDTVAIDHAFIYLFDDEKPAVDEGNKVCIVIKQHIGSGRKSGRTRKTCSNKRTNKALVIPDRDTNDENAAVANSEYREFTDEEFASGTVAYWLNYTQKGYTGEYSGEWTQGELYPVLDLDKKAPLVKLVYNITGTDDTEQFNGSTPFVNVGSIATLNYLQKPSSIKVNGVEVTTTMGATSAQFEVSGIDATTTPTVTVDVIYTVETGVADVAGETKEIVTKGDKVVVYGAAGERMTIVSLRGEEILSREIDSDVVTVVVPVSGIYMVEVGDMTKKVIIR